MSDLETLKAQHPAIRVMAEIAQREGHLALPEEKAVAAIYALVQQHEATIAELNTRLARARRINRNSVKQICAESDSDLAAAQATIAERDATIKEKDARIAELDARSNRTYEALKGHVPEHNALKAQLSSEQTAHAATREELRKAEETIQQQARELEETDGALLYCYEDTIRVGRAIPVAVTVVHRSALTRRHSARAQQEFEAKKEQK